MKNLTLFILGLFLLGASASAQTTAASVTLNKIAQPAMKLDLPIDDDATEDLFADNLKKTGYSEKSLFSKSNKIDEGFYAIKGVRLSGTKETVDLYVKIEQKGKKSNHESTVWMLISKEGGFITSSSDNATYSAAEKFLNAFVDQAMAYKLKMAIVDQEDVVRDAEKKQEKLQDRQKDMERKIDNLQKDLKENADDQKSQDKTIDEEKKKLEALKAEYKKYS